MFYPSPLFCQKKNTQDSISMKPVLFGEELYYVKFSKRSIFMRLVIPK